MPYLTMYATPAVHQITVDELLSGTFDISRYRVFPAKHQASNTRTVFLESPGLKVFDRCPISEFVSALAAFNQKYAPLIDEDRRMHYTSFHIPKSNGKLRRIDAPDDTLKKALYALKEIFESQGWALHHTTAFAYVRGRCAVDAVRRHQSNDSRWFLKLDFKDFFGSTTLDFLMEILAQIFPFSRLCANETWRDMLRRALSLCFYQGGLPQGTPISPLLTNLMMIPIDHQISNTLRDFDGNHFTYTRYADDILISSRKDFRFDSVLKLVENTLDTFHAPFRLNREKTRYGSRAGANWNLGVMLNQNNEITIGHKRKQQFRAVLTSYALDRKNGKPWPLYDVQVLMGQLNYYRSIEPEYINAAIRAIDEKFGTAIEAAIHQDLRGGAA